MPSCIRYAQILLLAGLMTGCNPAPRRQALLDGVRALETGRFDKAADLLETAARNSSDPGQRAVALNFLGVAMFRLGNFDSATDAFRKSIQADQRLAAPCYNLAALADKNNNEDEALALLAQAAETDFRSTSALEYAAAIHMRHQRWDMARVELDKAFAREPRSPSVLTALALIELQEGRPEDARLCLEKVVARSGSYAPAVYNLAIVCSQMPEHTREVESRFERFLALAPPEPQAGIARTALAAIRAKSAGAQGAPDARQEEAPIYQQFLDNARALTAAHRTAAAVNLFLRAAEEAEQLGRPEAARNAAEQAQAICPAEPGSSLAMALYWFEHARIDKAKAMAKQALAVKPNWPEALVVLARIADAERKYDVALDALAKALVPQPPNAEALWLRIVILSDKLAAPAKAGNDLRLFIRTHPNDPRVKEARTRLAKIAAPPQK